jgi:hypothetical protein
MRAGLTDGAFVAHSIVEDVVDYYMEAVSQVTSMPLSRGQ